MTEQTGAKQQIAVIGGGVAGIVAAYLLQQQHEVSLFEKNDYLGGHTHTIEITEGPDAGLAVDTGFIVLNDATYPLFQRFLARLGVATRAADMSFGFQCKQSGLVYAGNDLNGLFAQRRNLIRPSFWGFLFEIARFCRKAQRDLAGNSVPQVTLGAYLQQGRFSPYMVENYLLPMAAAIWSTPTLQAADFPAEAFLRFFNNHGLLSLRNRPQWRTVVGGSFSYVKAFQRDFRGKIALRSAVTSVTREAEAVVVRFADGRSQKFDQVVMACHADQTLRLLGDPSADERRLLAPWRYQLNHTVLHTDIGLLPERKAAWSAWNFTRETDTDDRREVFVTYSMNRLQGLSTHKHYCVTLNHRGAFAPETLIDTFEYEHPQYSFASLSTQAELPQLNGRRNSWFCGSYFGYGFHEDAVRSAVEVARGFGIDL
ncbi:NAD(P)/FAD-dependent oxidoreductase [Geoalkalibacter halelectricus]|uniref:FAD-dependent oxidoreductase n=1 Tax=Geoalkalibacter halelectricus TaxID=2847045 RepID=A0ABY5ZPS6_9BACT|nr:FAD-dependent oxidoreductase [Geoalkalibacter halelectricus]MDO3379787.1 FAD-dependent oxidoreductase [Geoalkalibacter halelectricus]UWZ79221.1 FAD-dependent oxidoreductase [Geoalkalibacter halelectricus]